MLLTLACTFAACTQPFPTAPDDALLLAQGSGDITVAYYCGNTFQFRNRSQDTLTLQWRVHGVQENGELRLEARGAADYSETYLTTQERGPLQVLRGGQVFATVPNRHTAQCEIPVTDTTRPLVPVGLNLPTANVLAAAHPQNPSLQLYRNILGLWFDSTASGNTIRSLLSRYRAQIIGGAPIAGADTSYIIQFPDPGPSFDSLTALVHRLEAEQGVRHVIQLPLHDPFRIRYRRPLDSEVASVRGAWTDRSAVVTQPWQQIRAPLAWGCEVGDPSGNPVELLVFDRAFDPATLPADLAGNVRAVTTPSPGDVGVLTSPLSSAEREHGVAVSSLLSAQGDNGVGIAGAIWSSNTFLYSTVDGGAESNNVVFFLAQSLVDARERRNARVINVSGGVGDPLNTSAELVIQRGLEYALAPGEERILVLAVGENSLRMPLTSVEGATNPGITALDRVVARMYQDTVYRSKIILVTANDRAGGMLAGSNVWTGIPDLVAAPGEGIRSLLPSQGSGDFYGTSFSAPLVSGLAALLWARDPSLTAAEVKALIVKGATPIGTDARRIDFYSSLRLAAERPNSPLCGNRMTIEGRSVLAERAPGSFVPLGTVDGTGKLFRLLTFHGGRKFTVRNQSVENAFVIQPDGTWAGPQTWDGDSTDLTGSAMSQFGETHDRDGVYHVNGLTLWKGKTWRDNTTRIASLPTVPGYSEGGAQICVRETLVNQVYQCQQTISTGFSQQGGWRQDVATLGDSGVLLMQEMYRYGTTYDPVWYDCFNTTQPATSASTCRFHWFSTAPTLRWVSFWRMDLAAPSPVVDSVGGIVSRYPVRITSAEDGSAFAVNSGTPNRATGYLDDCYTQFYTLPTSGLAIPDQTLHYYGSATCDYIYWEGGFGATQELLTATPAPPAERFALQARLMRAASQ